MLTISIKFIAVPCRSSAEEDDTAAITRRYLSMNSNYTGKGRGGEREREEKRAEESLK